MTTDTTRHYAEKVRALVAQLDAHHVHAVATLCQPEVSAETCRALQDARFTLEAELKTAAAQLASVVLAEPASCPAKAAGHACELPAGHDGEHTTQVYSNVTLAFGTPCGSEFAGHVCGLFEGHSEKHHDTMTDLHW